MAFFHVSLLLQEPRRLHINPETQATSWQPVGLPPGDERTAPYSMFQEVAVHDEADTTERPKPQKGKGEKRGDRVAGNESSRHEVRSRGSARDCTLHSDYGVQCNLQGLGQRETCFESLRMELSKVS